MSRDEISELNTGIIIAPPALKDWVAGDVSGIEFKSRLSTRDWSKYLPTDEKQYTSKYDTMSCVAFSALNSIEMQIHWMIKEGHLSKDQVRELKKLGFFDDDDNFNASDWFTAVMSGTRKTGNTLPNVWESIRKHGILPQEDGIEPNDVRNIDDWLDVTRVTQEQKDKALKFLEIFDIAYEWVSLGVSNPVTLGHHLEHAPLQIATAVCDGWRNGDDEPVPACDKSVQHATCARGSEHNKVTMIYDHYRPYQKDLAWDYPIPFAIKGVLTLKNEVVETPAEQPTKEMILPNTKKNIIINSGHHKADSGATHKDIIERDECYKVRDALVPILQARGYTVYDVPDDLDLAKSIRWANNVAPRLDSGLAIDIHFNSLSNTSVGGTEAFYGTSETSEKIAAALSSGISKALGTRNRGAKPDTQSAVGSLGWIRKTTMWASLVEICFITNDSDMELIKAENGYIKAATGIADGIDEIYGKDSPQPPVEPEPVPEPQVEDPEPPAVNDPVILKTFTEKQLLEELLSRQ